MVDVAQVRIWGRPVGAVRWDARYGMAQFEYDAGFVNTGIQPSPLMMPVQPGRVYGFGNLNRDTFYGLV